MMGWGTGTARGVLRDWHKEEEMRGIVRKYGSRKEDLLQERRELGAGCFS